MHHTLVVGNSFGNRDLTASLESIDETFRVTFLSHERSKAVYSSHAKNVTVFHICGKNVSKNQINKFKIFLESCGYQLLFSASHSELVGEIDTRFFTINLRSNQLNDIKELLISKFENALGRKLQVFGDVYYFHLNKSQIKNKKLVKQLDELFFSRMIDIIICIF